MQTKANGPAVSGEQVRRYRLAAHHLDRPLPPGSLTEAAGVCGVQNSPPGAWETALFARVAACTPALLRQALEEEKTLLQAWSFRGVPAVFPTAESSVFLSALAARPGEGPWIYTRGVTLALDFLGMEWDQALALVRQAASCLDGCTVQSKEELDRLLAEQAARTLPPQLREKWNAPSMYGRPDRQTVGGAVVSFALRPCSFLGLVVFGARQGPHPAFTSYRRWCGRPLPPDPEAERRLVEKFLHAYGPATRADLAAWLGCSPKQAARLWQTARERMLPVEKEGRAAWMLAADLPHLLQAAPPRQPLVLLGPHDPYLDARDRDLLLADPAGQRKVWRTAANPGVLLRGGQVAALWKPRAARGGMAVAVTPLAELSAAERRQAAAQAERYAQFRGTALTAFTVEEV